MVRGIFKKVEGIIALVIFISFIIFYLNFVKITLFNSEKYFETNRKFSIADETFNQLKKTGYIIGFRIYVPFYSKDLLCNINIENIKRDFCEKIPFFIPLNLSFLLKYDGVVNNTYNSLLKKDLGVFLYLNLSEFVCEDKNNNIIIEVTGPITSPRIIFFSTPTLYYWLKNNESILVLPNEFVDFEYCYLLSNGTCFDKNIGSVYGIVIKINNLLKDKVYFNISRNNLSKASSFNILNLSYTNYRIVYEPRCYKNVNFIILENLSFNFQDYTDLICVSYYMNNSNNLGYNYFQRELKEIYSGLSFYEEYSLYYSKIFNVGPACIQHYDMGGEEILNVYRLLFSNTSWFLELAEYNLSFSRSINIFNWSSRRYSGFYADYYFNFTDFIDDFKFFFTNKILLKNPEMYQLCKYVLIFLETTYLVTADFKRDSHRLHLATEKNIFMRPTIFYYCFSKNDEQMAKETYYGYSIPNYEISYINKINYVDIADLKDNDLTAFYLVNKNISIGDKNNKYYSRSYYTYLKVNNSLFEDYLVIYIK